MVGGGGGGGREGGGGRAAAAAVEGHLAALPVGDCRPAGQSSIVL